MKAVVQHRYGGAETRPHVPSRRDARCDEPSDSAPAARQGRGDSLMRAVVHDRYGPPEVLRVVDVERPVAKENEVLVRVHASTITRGDTELRTVEYPFIRPATGIRRPRRRIAGTEFAGRVEEVGSAVTRFEVGDE